MHQKVYEWVDVLRAIAVIGVIFIHTSSYLLYSYGQISVSHWWIGNVIDSFVRFSVPVFFMISGALLLSKKYTPKQFYKKRFVRLIPPFLFWDLVYIVYTLLQKFHHGEPQNLEDIFTITVNGLLFGSQYHLWFVYILIGIYLVIPFISNWARNAGRIGIAIFMVIWLSILLFNNLSIETSEQVQTILSFSGYLGYAIFGYFLFQNQNKILNNKLLAIVLFAVGYSITMFGTYYLTVNHGAFVIDFYQFLTLNVMLNSTGVFLFVKNLTITNSKILSGVKLISQNSYGIYLAHVFVLLVMGFFGFKETLFHPIIGIPILSLSCLLISLYLISLMKRTRIGRLLAG